MNESLADLYARIRSTGLPRRLFELAYEEDLGPASPDPRGGPARAVGDITSSCCIDPRARATANLVARSGGVMAGLASTPELIELFAPAVRAVIRVHDGERASAGQVAAVLDGPLDEILGLERTLLNLVGRLSGIATRTRTFVDAIPRGCRAKVYDTRKTTPGLRVLEKYAVRCGGGESHRMGLHDAVLIKDNHIAGVETGRLAAVIREASARARALPTRPTFVEVEVDNLEQFEQLLTLEAGVIDIVLLDNMGPDLLRRAVAMRDARCPRLELESSGGVTLETIPAIASTGVDRISIGGLTHSAVSLDVALDVVATS
ncbi:MAG: carboxylating nicotinate-nucleotide diphosphorylase [Phycisphaerales bacterium]